MRLDEYILNNTSHLVSFKTDGHIGALLIEWEDAQIETISICHSAVEGGLNRRTDYVSLDDMLDNFYVLGRSMRNWLPDITDVEQIIYQ